MNNYIVLPIIIMFMIGIFSQFYYSSAIDISSEGLSQSQTLQGNQTLTGEESELVLDEGSLSLDFTMTIGLVAIIAGAIALGLIGMNVLGSGLSAFSVKIIWNGIVYYGLWAIFSVLGFNAINSLPLFGLLFWFILTLCYTFGVFSKMGD